MNKINFVIVGVGNIGTKYVTLLNELPNAELVAIVDVNFGRRKSIAKLIPFFTSLEDFISARIPADVICICTPNGLHPSHTISCLNAGYHVICEKPVALEVDDVLKMIEAEKVSGKKVFAVMQNRYSPVALWLKKLMDQKLLGNILLLQINCFWNRNSKYYEDSPWRASKELGGGPLYSQFSHFIDLMIWICGNPYEVKSEFFSLNQQIQTEFKDSGIINFNLNPVGKGVFTFTNAAYQTNIESSLTIIGTKGNVKVGGQYMEKLDFVNLEKEFEVPVFDKVTQANNYSYYKGSADKHDVFLKNVIECLLQDKVPEIGLVDELNVIHFIEQAVLYAEAKSY
ncbi:Gfo/Idh/MocA family oxidoreductase [Pedobacter sp. SD-b]|uniref:Gfo/Idh/MocA family oxidoreductase n=1 Tax=Pedobacter segetis TaxID=2793069 RepID=A0ABS1BJV3_9SPHI|nr:Gfo/Idh/MocA family oxidoreductase [Pedobacter segetis]MBK0383164.1 Gfo/Idh/MocA family oxidoreductase [Pedobacter segetis]